MEGSEGIVKLTYFNSPEFDYMFEKVEDELAQEFETGRGRRFVYVF